MNNIFLKSGIKMKKILISLIKLYQKVISPIFHAMGVQCKYYPTCSNIRSKQLKNMELFKGIFLGIKRILKCNPFSKGGYDPLN